MFSHNAQPGGPPGFNQQALYGNPSALSTPHLAASTPQAHVAPPSFDAVNWFDNNTLEKWRDLHLLKIHHINIVESLNFVPEKTRKDLYLRLNEVGWPLRLRTLETAGNSTMTSAGVEWFQEDRNALVVLRQFGLSWATISSTFFVGHTPQDCMQEVIRLGYDPVTLGMSPGSALAQAVSSVSSRQVLASNALPARGPASATAAPGFVHHQASPVSATPSLPRENPSRADSEGSTTYVNHLKPFWTPDEDRILLEASTEGMKYSEIREKYLPHRTAKALNHRMNRLRHMGSGSKGD
ncbi:hypothetical protein BDV96DRAFT_644369 [Lophiotrema nucula]|uniref:Myb-like domain-containing protein n=1 Tax=Lophiotrema nucula TaxID=690887 RepID=A0A6A5ZGZ8_9PLEO|nr:hypothetical protein BDV96DRAFT_644369 [Lophiotrema nucula]